MDTQQIVRIGQMVEKSIDSMSNSVFDDNSGSNYSATEHIDTNEETDEYFLSKVPVTSVTNLYTTQNDQSVTPDYPNNTTEWTSLTEGTDFVVDLETGRVHIVNSSYQPLSRRWGLYVDYKYGRSTVPEDIKNLAILETGLRMMGATVVQDRIKKLTDIDVVDMDSFNMLKRQLLGQYKTIGVNSLNT